jgi:hypothetical protein
MAGKKTKNRITCNLIDLQDEGDISDGFPLCCFILSDNKGEIEFSEENFFHKRDNVKILCANTDWEQIAVESKLFSSRGDAKRNNFNGKIKEGWHEVTSGKGVLQKFIFVFKG